MGLKDWFRKGNHEIALLEQSIGHTVERIKVEKGLVFSWLHYFKEKDRIHEERYERVQRATERHQEHIALLKEEIFHLKTELHRFRTVTGQYGTNDRTQKGHEEGREKAERKVEKHNVFLEKHRLMSSELEILQLLYHADKPLSYQSIAKQISKSEKSIRNLVCDLRKKGVKIDSRPVGLRQRGFYLEEKQRLCCQEEILHINKEEKKGHVLEKRTSRDISVACFCRSKIKNKSFLQAKLWILRSPQRSQKSEGLCSALLPQ